MDAMQLIQHIEAASADKIFEELYGKDAIPSSRARYVKLAKETLEAFPETASDLRIFTAAGRTELGGNHTDHNRGKVLAASIQLDAIAFVSKRDDNRVLFRSANYPDVIVDLSDLQARKEEEGTTEALLRGTAAEFVKRGIKVGGFTANAANTVLSGSGLSSSAAVEVLFGAIFDGLYGDAKLSSVEIAQIGQKAENIYFGKPCGLMDQVACASGGAVAIDFADPQHPIVRQVQFDLTAVGYALCVVDTGGSHADLTSDYAAVPTEMKAVAQCFGKEVLRDLERSELIQKTKELRSLVGDRALLRAFHFFAENERVDAMLSSLEEANAAAKTGNMAAEEKAIDDFLDLVGQSGDSSWELLQNVFTPKLPKEQGVSLALALSREFFRTLGSEAKRAVCRVHGGGFAGTIQVYIPLTRMNEYIAWMEPIFGKKAVTVLRIRPIGARELEFDR
ncbi:galactokinase [Treponema sp.]